jgi:hypothetical protein
MFRTVGGLLVLSLALPAWGDQEKSKEKPATPKQQYQALLKEQNDAMRAFQEAYRKAKSQDERNKVFAEKYPRPEKAAAKFLELAKMNPKDPVALDALIWVVTRDRTSGKGTPRAKALSILQRDHIKSNKLGTVCQTLGYSSDEESTGLLHAILDKNPSRDVQGKACLALALSLKNRADGIAEEKPQDAEKLRKESEEFFERALNKYGDLNGGAVGKQAKSNLFELRYLSIGKEAPEIVGEDADSKSFKLSDYRGKVVLLDFWGNW